MFQKFIIREHKLSYYKGTSYASMRRMMQSSLFVDEKSMNNDLVIIFCISFFI